MVLGPAEHGLQVGFLFQRLGERVRGREGQRLLDGGEGGCRPRGQLRRELRCLAASSLSAITRLNNPSSAARSASTGSASISSSAARAWPVSRCSVQDDPESGPRPTRANAISTLALRAASRKSQANASEAPAPAATPFTAAITGLGIPAITLMIGL